MNKDTSKITFEFNQWIGWNFKENSSYRANPYCLWDFLFINSDKALTKNIFETIADLSNLFIRQLIQNTKVIKSINLNWLQ